ncbi:MAG: helix-turn-helix transcriptional regulator [Lachnospiraceae bacterium]|nr:helix-turn-helix transcriptional regulator [Lachnospiraceae bacterium]
MLTKFGKFCRKIRIDEGKLLMDMANQLGVSAAFLSKVENGKAKPPVGWEDIIVKDYELNTEQEKELRRCIQEARETNIVQLTAMTEDDRDLMLQFARKLDTLEETEKNRIRKILGS